jgi:hypothetical protein
LGATANTTRPRASAKLTASRLSAPRLWRIEWAKPAL